MRATGRSGRPGEENVANIPSGREMTIGPSLVSSRASVIPGPREFLRSTFTSPGRPDRPVALKRRQLPELLAEELRRLDEDEVYARTARKLLALSPA